MEGEDPIRFSDKEELCSKPDSLNLRLVNRQANKQTKNNIRWKPGTLKLKWLNRNWKRIKFNKILWERYCETELTDIWASE